MSDPGSEYDFHDYYDDGYEQCIAGLYATHKCQKVYDCGTCVMCWEHCLDLEAHNPTYKRILDQVSGVPI